MRLNQHNTNKIINLIPDITVIFSVIVTYIIDENFPIIEIVPHPINVFGWLIVIGGIIVALYTISFIRSRNRTSNVTDAPPALITNGLYSHTRNPFYLSYIAVTIGAAVILGSLSAFIGPIICIILLQLIVHIEEKKLKNIFGQKYRQYQNSVRRWI